MVAMLCMIHTIDQGSADTPAYKPSAAGVVHRKGAAILPRGQTEGFSVVDILSALWGHLCLSSAIIASAHTYTLVPALTSNSIQHSTDSGAWSTAKDCTSTPNACVNFGVGAPVVRRRPIPAHGYPLQLRPPFLQQLQPFAGQFPLLENQAGDVPAGLGQLHNVSQGHGIIVKRDHDNGDCAGGVLGSPQRGLRAGSDQGIRPGACTSPAARAGNRSMCPSVVRSLRWRFWPSTEPSPRAELRQRQEADGAVRGLGGQQADPRDVPPAVAPRLSVFSEVNIPKAPMCLRQRRARSAWQWGLVDAQRQGDRDQSVRRRARGGFPLVRVRDDGEADQIVSWGRGGH